MKKEWIKPRLTVHGTVERITATCDKRFGATDGFTFMGQAIVCNS